MRIPIFAVIPNVRSSPGSGQCTSKSTLILANGLRHLVVYHYYARRWTSGLERPMAMQRYPSSGTVNSAPVLITPSFILAYPPPPSHQRTLLLRQLTSWSPSLCEDPCTRYGASSEESEDQPSAFEHDRCWCGTRPSTTPTTATTATVATYQRTPKCDQGGPRSAFRCSRRGMHSRHLLCTSGA